MASQQGSLHHQRCLPQACPPKTPRGRGRVRAAATASYPSPSPNPAGETPGARWPQTDCVAEWSPYRPWAFDSHPEPSPTPVTHAGNSPGPQVDPWMLFHIGSQAVPGLQPYSQPVGNPLPLSYFPPRFCLSNWHFDGHQPPSSPKSTPDHIGCVKEFNSYKEDCPEHQGSGGQAPRSLLAFTLQSPHTHSSRVGEGTWNTFVGHTEKARAPGPQPLPPVTKHSRYSAGIPAEAETKEGGSISPPFHKLLLRKRERIPLENLGGGS